MSLLEFEKQNESEKYKYNRKERNTYIFVDTRSAFYNAPTAALKMVHYKNWNQGNRITGLGHDGPSTCRRKKLYILRAN